MCSAVRRRMLVCGTAVSRSPARATGWGAGAGRVGAGAAGWAAAAGWGGAAGAAGAAVATWAAAPPWSSTARTSLRVMRPPGPVPLMAAGSRLFSLINRRTTGDSRRLPFVVGAPPPVGAGAGAGAWDGPGAGCWAAGAGVAGWAGPSAAVAWLSLPSGAGAAWGSGAGDGASAAGASSTGASAAAGASSAGASASAGASPPPAGASPTRASTAPTSTVSPSSTRISDSVPLTGDGTSESTLSVETSKRGSSSATVSPTCLNHLVIVPSVTVSPSCGIWMSAIRPGPPCRAGRRGASRWSGRWRGWASVQPASGQILHRVAEQLGQRGVRLDEGGDLVDRGFPVDGQVTLAELLGHPRAHHVDADDGARLAVGRLLGDDLHQALLVAYDLGPAVGAVAVLGGHDIEPGLLGRLLRVAGERDLGPAVDAPRHLAVVDGDGVLAEDAVDGHHRLGEADVGELRRGDAVPHGPHAVLAGLAQLVDQDEASLVELHLGAVEAEVVGGGLAADRHDHHIGLDGVGAVDVDHRAAVARFVAGDLDPGAHLDAPLLEGALDDRGHVLVTPGQDLGQRLEHRDLRAEVGHHRRELAADGAAADDHGGAGQRRRPQDLVRRHDDRARGLEGGGRGRL